MKLSLVGHDDRYAVEQLLMSLLGPSWEGEAVSTLHRGSYFLTAVTRLKTEGKTVFGYKRLSTQQETVRLRRQCLQQSLYRAAVQLLPQKPAWGALAGVRPTKVTSRHLLEGGSEALAREMLKKVYYVTEKRCDLAIACSQATVKAAAALSPEDISLYVGIPFCPSRCSYCSFVSRTVGKGADLLEPYLSALHREIEVTGRLLAQSGKKIRSLYIGGGTPTTLSICQLSQLMDNLTQSFDLSRCLEFTVEAGRPDTLSLEKLKALKDHGADRVSINPQSMVDSVLRACRRPHSAQDVLNAYGWALDAGFENINMDLIAGLPTDDYQGFCHSLEAVAQLQCSNVTVHTLSLKKGADLFEHPENLSSAQTVSKMVDYANDTLSARGYRPYYLYRQKYMSGSFENVGWSMHGKDCLYNIYMMEELHTVLSLGGGGMTKLNLPDGSLQRFHNPKFPQEYIDMVDSVLAEKENLFALMKGRKNSWTL